MFLEGYGKAFERLQEDYWKVLKNILRKASRGGSRSLLSGVSGGASGEAVADIKTYYQI